MNGGTCISSRRSQRGRRTQMIHAENPLGTWQLNQSSDDPESKPPQTEAGAKPG